MGLIAEISRALGAEEISLMRVQYTVIDGRGGYFQGVKRIVEFSDKVIVFKGRKGAIRVEGENLALGKYFAGDAVVLGSITGTRRCD